MLAPKKNTSEGHQPKKNTALVRKPAIQKKELNKSGLQAVAKPTMGGKMAVFGGRGKLQAKLKVGSPNDKFEKEADSVADKVVNKNAEPTVQKTTAPPIQTMKVNSTDLQKMSEPDEDLQMKESEDEVQMQSMRVVQRMEAGSDEDDNVQLMSEDDSEVQMKVEPSIQRMEESSEGEDAVQLMAEDDSEVQMMESEDEVQAKFRKGSNQGTPNIGSDLKSAKGGGQKLDATTKSQMESGFGHDLSGVNIHNDSRSAKMNKELGAKAFTNGADIYFNEGQYRPETKEGKQLLAHELTHTLQQGAVDSPLSSEATESPISPSSKSSKESSKATKKAAKAEAKALKKAAKSEKKDAKKAGKEGEEKKEEKKQLNPKEDPNFIAVTGNIAKESKGQQAKEDPTKLSENAQEAAESPASEAGSLAMVDQVDEMEAQEPKEFSAEAFKEKLMARIAEMQLPKNNEEAEEFDKNNNIDEVNEAALGDVEAEKDVAGGAIEQSTDKEPVVGAKHQRKVEKLPPVKKSKKPKAVNAKTAVPQVRPAAEVEKPMKDETAKMDNTMAENNVTDEQLAKSEEPTFTQALDSKNEAKSSVEPATQAMRGQESTTLTNNAAKAEGTSKEQLEGMKILNNSAVGKVAGGQKEAGSKDTSERDRIAGEINAIYDTTKKDVTKILEDLDTNVEKMFTDASTKAKYAFEKYVEVKVAKYKYDRYLSKGLLIGGGLWVKDLFVGLPDEVNRYFDQGRELFLKVMDIEITKIAKVVATELNRATQRIEDGKQEVTTYVEELPSNLKKFGKEAASDIRDKFDELSEEVNSKEEDLVDMLAEEYVASLEEVDARIEEMKAANRGLVGMAMDFINGVIETIRKLKEAINGLLSAIASAIEVIMADPIGFMGTLFEGIGKGIDMFKANIQKHLLGGLLEWLTGSLGPIGIQMPNDIFSLSGVFDITIQVLGLGWDFIRLQAVRMMGEPMVKVLEGGFSMFKTFATKGAAGIWEFVKDKFQDIKATVIDAIKDMLITKVLEAGIKWLLSLLIPGAGFIKAIMAIKDIIVFFVESAIMLIPAITKAILALAAGNLAGVAEAFEFGLGKLITLVIGLFARLIGLGGLTKKVMKIFKKIRKRIAKAIRKLLQKAKRAGRKLMRKIKGKGKKGDAKKIKEENKKGKPEKLTAKDKAKHKKIVKNIKDKLSEKSREDENYEQFYARKKKEATAFENKYQPQLKKGINIDIDMISLKKDKKDNDVDFKIKIAPNTTKDDGEAQFTGDSIPPKGKAYLIRQPRKIDHYKVFLSDGRFYDLMKGKNNIIEIRRSKPVPKVKTKNKNIIIISVSESAPKGTKTQVEQYNRDWKAKKYVLFELDCLTFAVQFLNDRLDLKAEKLHTPEVTDELIEANPGLDDNEIKFKSLKKFNEE